MAAPTKGLRLLAIVVLALGVLALVAQVVVSRFFSARYLEELLEESLNASVQVEGVKVNLFAGRVSLRGVSLLPKEATHYPTAVEVSEVRLGVKALPLLARRLESSTFVISEPVVKMTLDREGDLSVAELFRKPKDKKRKPEDTAQDIETEEEGVLEAENNPWLAKLSSARLEGGRVEMLFEKEKLLMRVEDLAIVLTDLQFDPENLATLNQVQMELAAQARLFDSQKMQLVHLDLSGEAEGKLFDGESGEFDADVVADLALGKGSHLNPQIKIVRRVWRYLDQVERWGISLGSLPSEIGFGRSRRIVGSYRDDRVTLREPLSLSAGKWELGLARDSWIATESGLHEIGIEFLAGEKISETVGGWLDALPKEARTLAANRFVDEEQVLWRVNSSGELKDPEFDFLNQLPEAKGILDELEDSLENEIDGLRDKADDFLKGLFD